MYRLPDHEENAQQLLGECVRLLERQRGGGVLRNERLKLVDLAVSKQRPRAGDHAPIVQRIASGQ